MAQLDDLAARMDAVEKRLDSLENEKIYNYMDDNMPDWAKPTIQKLMDRGYLNGTGDNELGLTMDIIRMCVMIDNANGFRVIPLTVFLIGLHQRLKKSIKRVICPVLMMTIWD